jgi:hypothetical protein
MKKIQQHIRAIYTALILKVSGKFFNRHDTRILNSMEDYKVDFDLDSKIAQNRFAIRELFEKYKKIEVYYPLFLVYLGGIAVYYFDFIPLLGCENIEFSVLTGVTGISVLYSLHIMYKVIETKDWYNDYIVSDLVELKKDIKKENPKLTKKKIILETKKEYLSLLEEWLETNYTSYTNKKRKISFLIKVMFISIVLYSINISFYKQLQWQNKNQVEEKLE